MATEKLSALSAASDERWQAEDALRITLIAEKTAALRQLGEAHNYTLLLSWQDSRYYKHGLLYSIRLSVSCDERWQAEDALRISLIAEKTAALRHAGEAQTVNVQRAHTHRQHNDPPFSPRAIQFVYYKFLFLLWKMRSGFESHRWKNRQRFGTQVSQTMTFFVTPHNLLLYTFFFMWGRFFFYERWQAEDALRITLIAKKTTALRNAGKLCVFRYGSFHPKQHSFCYTNRFF